MKHLLSSPLTPARLVVIFLFIAVWAGSWDVWWHAAIGRETFWSPPHLLLYASVTSAVGLGILSWRRFKDARWKQLAIALVLIPLSAPFDELWHRLFGVESIASPLIVWSPPHLLLIGAIIYAFLRTLPVIREDRNDFRRTLFACLSYAGMLSLGWFVTAPLMPIGPFYLLGFWGAAFSSGVLVCLFLHVRRFSGQAGAAFLVAALSFLSGSINFGQHLRPETDIPLHGHVVSWLMIASFILPAMLVDLVKFRKSAFTGLLAGLVHGVVIFPFARIFIEPGFAYDWTSVGIGVLASVLGGLVAGALQKSSMLTNPA